MGYAVKEIVYTIQGEGANAGSPAVFCRFTGCNLWSGREVDRATAICRFCDTDFVGVDGYGGGRFSDARELAEAIRDCWSSVAEGTAEQFVVFTGGEPLLQLDASLIEAVKEVGFKIAVETNGTLDAPPGIDWVCVSPKAGTCLRIIQGDELKLVYPQIGIEPEDVDGLDFAHFFLQPMAGPDEEHSRQASMQYCLRNPQWRLSLQLHKILQIP